ncbi:hypothetical protein B0F90DRAFT_1717251 [Multifurca ochricompacta]|uniref:BTB domain-containing protein n=1 Tax=Multifurca ochricompacta TaxID=376703 RepID=A0AAD4M6W0_9AGAM|nr:hypothetical protein B0F90DRAFT_1717251 [Multifurca ochricompacta]
MPTLETSTSNTVISDKPPDKFLFDYAGADIILRSCDSFSFRIPRLYITNSSPVLSELIRGATRSSRVEHSDAIESLPVVQLRENGVILFSLLTFIFPVSPTLPSTVEGTMELLSVAQKYGISSALSHIRGNIAVQNTPIIRPETAFQVYSLAQKFGLHQELLQAARATLTFPMTIGDLEGKLENMTGTTLHELWEYREKVQNHLASDLAEFGASGAGRTMTGLRCMTLVGPSQIPYWLDVYIESIGRAPHLFDIFEFETTRARHVKEGANNQACACAFIPSQTIRTFWDALTAVVQGSMEKTESALRLLREGVDPQIETSSFKNAGMDIPDANLILQSSDLVDFPVHKSVLAMTSPFFRDLLSLPQPSDSEGLHVIQLSEDAELLCGLISMIYPISPVIPNSYDKVLDLLAACQKYDMASIQSFIRAEVSRGTFPAPIEAEAFRAYAIASSKRLTPETENAARLTLAYPMTHETLGENLRLFEGGDDVVSCLELFLDIRTEYSKIWVGCPSAPLSSLHHFKDLTRTLPSWLKQLFSSRQVQMKNDFSNAFLTPSNIRAQYLEALLTHANCGFCSQVNTKDGEKYCADLKSALEKAINKIPVTPE